MIKELANRFSSPVSTPPSQMTGEQPEPQAPPTKDESGNLPATGDYTLMGAAVAAIAGGAALGYGVYASKRTH